MGDTCSPTSQGAVMRTLLGSTPEVNIPHLHTCCGPTSQILAIIQRLQGGPSSALGDGTVPGRPRVGAQGTCRGLTFCTTP